MRSDSEGTQETRPLRQRTPRRFPGSSRGRLRRSEEAPIAPKEGVALLPVAIVLSCKFIHGGPGERATVALDEMVAVRQSDGSAPILGYGGVEEEAFYLPDRRLCGRRVRGIDAPGRRRAGNGIFVRSPSGAFKKPSIVCKFTHAVVTRIVPLSRPAIWVACPDRCRKTTIPRRTAHHRKEGGCLVRTQRPCLRPVTPDSGSGLFRLSRPP